MVEALYARQLTLDPAVAEPVLRTAHALGVSCILSTTEQYVADHFLPESPAEVCLRARCTARDARPFPVCVSLSGPPSPCLPSSYRCDASALQLQLVCQPHSLCKRPCGQQAQMACPVIGLRRLTAAQQDLACQRDATSRSTR